MKDNKKSQLASLRKPFFYLLKTVAMVHFKLLVLPLLAVVSLVTANVESITDCPKLAPRKTSPKDVTDLRADDIEVVAALGDRYV